MNALKDYLHKGWMGEGNHYTIHDFAGYALRWLVPDAEKEHEDLKAQVREWTQVMETTEAYIGNGEIIKRIRTAVEEMREAAGGVG